MNRNDKILIMTFPFLTPLCPSLGLASLKGYLNNNDYKNIKVMDTMTVIEIRELCYRYFNTLENFIPEFNKGHFFNVGLDVFSNHFMAYINNDDDQIFNNLIHSIIYKNYYVSMNEKQIIELNNIVNKLFSSLEKYLLDLVDKEKPAIFGASVYRGTVACSTFALRLIKMHYPDIITVMGGAIFSQELFIDTPNYNKYLEYATFVDKFFIGEGEILFLKFLNGELDVNKRVYTLRDIDNNLINVQTSVMPDFSDFNLKNYMVVPHYTSRGCIYQCNFCAETVYWIKYRKKSPEKVVNELMALSDKYDTNLFVLTDCLINPLVTGLAEEIIKRNVKLYWDVYIKVDNQVCTPDMTMLWRKGGFYRARLGIESGSQKVLDLIDKQITVEQIKKALQSLAVAGIKTTTYWITGYPGETEEDFQMTLDMLTEMQDYIFEAEADPFRYFYKGQVGGEKWFNNNGNSLLYPEDKKNMLILQTWELNAYPSREIIYERASRFRKHCKKLGIPNPYSVKEIQEADKRWEAIHVNAVPSIFECQKSGDNIIDLIKVSNTIVGDIDFNF